MSDVGIGGGAPPAPSSAPPSQGEAPISAPVNTPNPVSNQVTDQRPPDDSSGFKSSRRDTIAKAFERARTDPVPTNRPKPSIGHNQPPEATPREAQAAPPKEKPEPKLDLKKRPADELPHEGRRRRREERQRDEVSGRFAAQQSPQGAPAQAGVGQPQPGQPRPGQAAPIANPLPPQAPYREPLARMDPRAKAEWHQAPESVRASMHRMYKEFDTAARQMRADREVMNTIRHFHQMAQQQGTTLARAMHNYTTMEDKLRTDPIGGIDVIVNNLNLRTEDGQRLGSRDIAYEILRRSPEQHQLMQSQNSQVALAQQLEQIQQRQQALEYRNAQMQYAQQFVSTRGQVDRFAETHPRLDELGAVIERELKLGFDLPTAYRRADLLHPAGSATHAAQTRTASAQTRSDRSITGAPDSSLNGGPRRQRPSASPRDAVAAAMRRMNGL